ncbi:MAG: RraA family protein [Anaerolineales bacterium]|nr:RraA family protein [Anaerolineales bacterium]
MPLTAAQIAALRAIDTPTICNAIESFNVRGRLEGFTGLDIRCLLPGQGYMVGYAVTLTADASTPDGRQDPAVWRAWLEAMAASPQPVVLIMQDVGPQPRKSAHFGEVMGTLARRLGAVGVVTNGGVRDLDEVRRLGLHYFAAGAVPSHGQPRLLSVGQPVQVDGVTFQPGDLVHGDLNGLTVIPAAIAAQVAAAADLVRADEAELLAYIQSPAFSIAGFMARKFSH